MADLAPGAYDHLITNGLDHELNRLEPELIARQKLDPADAHEVLARHIAALTRRALRSVGHGDDQLARQIALTNHIAAAIPVVDDDLVAISHELLRAIIERPALPAEPTFPLRPAIPFSASALLVNGPGQPRIGSEVVHEMGSADSVDLLCAFIKWHGVRLVEQAIKDLIGRGGSLRVITTTYMGATDQRALDRLVALGADVRVSYDSLSTRLHAKAWLFRRATGTSTAYVGSSNMSKSAMVDGLEWNVRLSEIEQHHLIDTFEGTFEQYWNDPDFEDYQPARDRERLAKALAAESGPRPTELDINIATLDVHPYGYQREVLDELRAEREIHDRRHNLVVMATGTGKTIVAALDYRQLRREGAVETLLFVAHQEQILKQSQSVFRHVVADGTFGERFVGGERPARWQHVFASIQSLNRLDLDQLAADQFDMIIVDEFHHAEAATYTRLLGRLRPKYLLGLTATPERADGLDITHWFGGRTAVELRLWEALERQFLAPLQYFGIHDDVDLSRLHWRRGQGYDATELSNVYTGHHARARLILQAVTDKVDVSAMRSVGFCVSIGHAEFMAEQFSAAGIPSLALTSRLDLHERDAALRRLRSGELRALFTVDLLNEGVDVASIDTVMLLRPTDSATIFLQQIGRGLRRNDDKACLTVLDFIGGQNANFRFDLRFRALTGASRRELERDVERDFPTLPAGCHIELDRVAKEIVLGNIKSALRIRREDLVAELRQLGDVPLHRFLTETGLEVEDIYRRRTLRGWAGLRRGAGLDESIEGPREAELAAAIGRLLHVNDPDRLEALRSIATGESDNSRVTKMASALLLSGRIDVSHAVAELAAHPGRQHELLDVIDVLHERLHRVTIAPASTSSVPLRVHGTYNRNEALIAFGVSDPTNLREGVKWVEAEQADLFFVTLEKTEEHYSPSTMYEDRALTPSLFQWESQSTTSSASRTGQRYIHHRDGGSTVHLFIRQKKAADGDLGAPPYLYAGPMTYVSHTGDRPMRVTWHLDHDLPPEMFRLARFAAG